MVSNNFLLTGTVAILLSVPVATAQLPTGSVSDVTRITCPHTLVLNARSACYTATVTCPDVYDTPVTFGVTTPAAPRGTIVLHDGDAGMSPYQEPGITDRFAQNYLSAAFQVVQLAWGGTGWESAPPGDIKSGACRPATFFQYIYQNFYSGGRSAVYNPTTNPTAGFCLQGHSAGAGAIAYYLTHYGGAAYVDKALFSSGPHFAEIDQGCEVPAPSSPIIICPNGGGAWPCAVGVDPPGDWAEYPAYTYGQLGGWTASPCSDGKPTSPAQDTAWSIMSIVDLQQTPSDANYVMPQTALSAYLCHYTGSQVNPSEAQGWLYYSQFQQADVASLVVNEVNDCQNNGAPSPEYVFYATHVNGTTGTPQSKFTWAPTVMFHDMTDPVNGCVRRH
ncbi:MAG TPA: hypothetical protein VMT20_11305 [Terriglobia bacterium]|nr:hypothetical protein [Terriglobia bacterium]